ncbi:MAG: alpha-amylase family glycosyl hydrolase, partial [Candidatus Competibacterales bacterium]|nr:alpha-amylase family glycosyl hydrolase [Candidatus Competibacterales bacterium]
MSEQGPPEAPRATYRLQFNADFRFTHARALVPYLADLGISHVYASPLLMARPGSSHGYDIVDHGRLNPEIGSEAEFDELVDELHRHDMGLILDFVPNHMGVGGDNPWWMDVLEWGQSSPYAGYFDIDWRPPEPSLNGKLLLPVLGDHYGAILERGELQLHFDAQEGRFAVGYFEHVFPLAPRDYPALLQEAAGRETAAQAPLLALAEAFQGTHRIRRIGERRRQVQIQRQGLAALAAGSEAV